jgi:hypothetical protein
LPSRFRAAGSAPDLSNSSTVCGHSSPVASIRAVLLFPSRPSGPPPAPARASPLPCFPGTWPRGRHSARRSAVGGLPAVRVCTMVQQGLHYIQLFAAGCLDQRAVSLGVRDIGVHAGLPEQPHCFQITGLGLPDEAVGAIRHARLLQPCPRLLWWGAAGQYGQQRNGRNRQLRGPVGRPRATALRGAGCRDTPPGRQQLENHESGQARKNLQILQGSSRASHHTKPERRDSSWCVGDSITSHLRYNSPHASLRMASRFHTHTGKAGASAGAPGALTRWTPGDRP